MLGTRGHLGCQCGRRAFRGDGGAAGGPDEGDTQGSWLPEEVFFKPTMAAPDEPPAT